MNIAFNTWFPVLTLIAGYLMKLVEDRLTHDRALARERENRRETRRIQLAERRADFQRKTLLDLQEALQDLARGTGAIIHADTMMWKETGRWGKHELQEGISQTQFDANRRCILLITRVRNDEIRELAHSFRTVALEASNSPDEKTANNKMFAAITSLEKLHALIGKQLRTIDEEEEAKVSQDSK